MLNHTVANLEDPNMQFMTQPQVSGTRGGHTVTLQQLARQSINLLGGLKGASGDRLLFREGHKDNWDLGDGSSQRIRDMIDGYIAKAEIDAPPAEADPVEAPNPGMLAGLADSLDLKQAGINTII